jgi:hypothetical protein
MIPHRGGGRDATSPERVQVRCELVVTLPPVGLCTTIFISRPVLVQEGLPHKSIVRQLYAMLLRPAYLSKKLTRPLRTKDGGTLRTISEACDYTTSMGKKRELRDHWQRVCKLVLAKEDVGVPLDGKCRRKLSGLFNERGLELVCQ